MIILSQDGERLVDATAIFYCVRPQDDNHCIQAHCQHDHYLDLGLYSTKERCLEVIEEIADLYKPDSKYVYREKSFCYKMPKE